MILKDKVLNWIKNGIEADAGHFDKTKKQFVEERKIIELTKDTLKDGSFIRAVLFELYNQGWIESSDWDEIQKQVVEIIEQELSLSVE